MKNKLEPCPFCGGKAKIRYETELSAFFVECLKCLASSALSLEVGKGEDAKLHAIESWNCRANFIHHAEKVETNKIINIQEEVVSALWKFARMIQNNPKIDIGTSNSPSSKKYQRIVKDATKHILAIFGKKPMEIQ